MSRGHADEVARVRVAAHLERRLQDLHAGGAGELAELLHRGLRLGPRAPLPPEADEDRALAPGPGSGSARRKSVAGGPKRPSV